MAPRFVRSRGAILRLHCEGDSATVGLVVGQVDGFPDGPFPDGYGLVAPPISESGVDLYALQPLREGVEHIFILRAYKGEKMVGEKKPALMHENRFGIDGEDFDTLELATEELLRELGGSDGKA